MAKKGQHWAKRKAKIDIRIPEDLKEAIKQAADEENITFTEWIEQALRAALTRPKHELKERRG